MNSRIIILTGLEITRLHFAGIRILILSRNTRKQIRAKYYDKTVQFMHYILPTCVFSFSKKISQFVHIVCFSFADLTIVIDRCHLIWIYTHCFEIQRIS
jgi:hypothetical protein